jgi:hypothetical protein
MRRADPLGRAERIPPQNSLLAPSPALPRKATPPWLAPLGGAGSARPHGNALASPWHVPARSSVLANPPRRGGLRTPATTAQRQLRRCLPLATGSSSTHVVEMKCLGLRTALPPGRGDRAPPRKSLLALSPGFPRQAISPRSVHPPGGAGSARPQCRHNANRIALPLRPPASRLPVDRHTIPSPASSLATRTRRPRPSEKITLRLPLFGNEIHSEPLPPGPPVPATL